MENMFKIKIKTIFRIKMLNVLKIDCYIRHLILI